MAGSQVLYRGGGGGGGGGTATVQLKAWTGTARGRGPASLGRLGGSGGCTSCTVLLANGERGRGPGCCSCGWSREVRRNRSGDAEPELLPPWLPMTAFFGPCHDSGHFC